VWVGRRLGYLGRFRDAIAELSRGLSAWPDEPHLLRHRGHRYITVRDFEAARRDLQRAAEVVRGQPDEIEPDGQPVEGRPPHSTLQFNVHYHLGLACFLLGDFAAAEAAWRDCLAVVRNDEARVAVTHWLWCALARQGRKEAAAPLLAAIPAEPDVVENVSYLQLCRLYAGVEDVKNLRVVVNPWSAALDFGVAHRAFVLGETGAEAELRRVAMRADWPSFGVIAAEALLAQR
jgi:tetratricopeptide (TPR) repeat protein